MTLYFKNSEDKMRLIGSPESNEEAIKIIDTFLEERNYKSYYKIQNLYDDRIEFDVGSWTEFFILYYNKTEVLT